MSGLVIMSHAVSHSTGENVIIVFFMLLSTGLAVKTWRLANPSSEAAAVLDK